MKLGTALLCLTVMIPGVVSAQQGPPDDRRQMLQGEIVRRFLHRTSAELRLDAATRSKLEQQLRQSGEQRRQLAQSTAQLRRQLVQASRDSTTSDAEFKRIISESTALRQKEEEIWRADQEALSRILTPRQHATFIFMWLRFNEQIREMALRPPPHRPGLPR